MSKNKGEQNVFYFEPSRLLPSDKTLPEYLFLYSKIPVICLLGWAGAQDQHLVKYSRIYSQLGYHTLRFSPSMKITFFITKALQKKYANEFLESFNNYGIKKNLILVHIFSNASGFVIYQHVLRDMSPKASLFKQNQAGVIFDSAPGEPVEMPEFLDEIVKISGVSFRPLRSMTVTILLKYFKVFIEDNFLNYLKTVKETILPPCLYMYTRSDKIISANKIAEFIEEKEELFPNMYSKSVVYEDGEHAMIMVKHPDDYLKQIVQHLKVCNCDLDHVRYINDNSSYQKSKL